MKTFCYDRLGKARKILQEMVTAVNTFLKDKSFTYFEVPCKPTLKLVLVNLL